MLHYPYYPNRPLIAIPHNRQKQDPSWFSDHWEFAATNLNPALIGNQMPLQPSRIQTDSHLKPRSPALARRRDPHIEPPAIYGQSQLSHWSMVKTPKKETFVWFLRRVK